MVRNGDKSHLNGQKKRLACFLVFISNGCACFRCENSRSLREQNTPHIYYRKTSIAMLGVYMLVYILLYHTYYRKTSLAMLRCVHVSIYITIPHILQENFSCNAKVCTC